MPIRLTSVGRVDTENSGYHPLRMAEINGDQIWAIPGKTDVIRTNQNIIILNTEKLFRKVLNLRFLRILSLIEIYMKALFRPSEIFFVHSFIFSIPILLAKRKFVLIIHGSDRKYLNTFIGAFVGKRALDVLGVGFSQEYSDYAVVEVPNVFDLKRQETVMTGVSIEYDVAFVLRNARVKNPSYPSELAANYTREKFIRIAVIGINESDVDNVPALYPNKNIAVDFFGRRTPEFVASILKKSKIIVIPSFSEGVSKAMLEAMSHGLHVIVSDTLSLPTQFEDHVHRLELYNWEQVFQKLEELRMLGESCDNEKFVRNYLLASEKSLSKIYEQYQQKNIKKGE